MMGYYGFHWPPNKMEIVAKDDRSVFYISHEVMRGVLITVKYNRIARQYVVRSYKHQYVRALPAVHVEANTSLREKGYANGNA